MDYKKHVSISRITSGIVNVNWHTSVCDYLLFTLGKKFIFLYFLTCISHIIYAKCCRFLVNAFCHIFSVWCFKNIRLKFWRNQSSSKENSELFYRLPISLGKNNQRIFSIKSLWQKPTKVRIKGLLLKKADTIVEWIIYFNNTSQK